MNTTDQQEGVLTLNNVRISFPTLFEAKAVNNGKPQFNVASLLSKTHPDLPKVYAAMEAAAKAKWGDKAGEIAKQLKAGDRLAVHDGEAKSQYEGYAGNLFLNASNKKRPLVIDRDRSILEEKDGKPYAGCFCNVRVQIWAQDNDFGKRINASLLGVQFVGDGERLAGGAVAAPDDFEPIPEAATGEAAASSMFN